jgi:hypothetical protein
MKYDPEQFTRESFRAWLATQNPDRVFDYCDPRACVFASYLHEALGIPFPNVGPENYDICTDDTYSETEYRKLAFPPWAESLSTEMAYRSEERRDRNKLNHSNITIAEVSELDAAI